MFYFSEGFYYSLSLSVNSILWQSLCLKMCHICPACICRFNKTEGVTAIWLSPLIHVAAWPWGIKDLLDLHKSVLREHTVCFCYHGGRFWLDFSLHPSLTAPWTNSTCLLYVAITDDGVLQCGGSSRADRATCVTH